MSSGQSNDNASNEAPTSVHDMSRKWLAAAYGDSPVATMVIDDDDRVIFANDVAQQLVGIDVDESISAIEFDEGAQDFGVLVDNVRNKGPTLGTWKGRLTNRDQPIVEIEFSPLPAPSPLILCRLQPIEQVDEKARIRLISDLSNLHRRGGDLDSTGSEVVDTIHRHLGTAVVGYWYEDGERQTGWRAGDESQCDRLESTATGLGEITADSVSFFHDDRQEIVVLSLALGGQWSAVLAIAVNSRLSVLGGTSPFWNCLTATSKTTLYSAKLLEMNRQERLRLRTVIEQMPLAVMIFDTDGRVLDLNLRARVIAGRRTWKQIGGGDYPFEVLDPDGHVLPREEWPLIRAVERGIVCEEEQDYVLDFGDYQRTVALTVVPITDENDRVTSYLATGRDVTQRTEEERRKDRFLSVASHELRSPLTPLSGFLQLSRRQAESGRDVDIEVLKSAESQVRRLQRLIDGLLDVTRLETGTLPVHRTAVDINHLVQRIMRPWQSGVDGDRIELSLPDQTRRVCVDPDRIDQVLSNLIDNAIKHSRSDGTVYVRLDIDDQEIVLEVSDEGDGMPQEKIDRVFDCYFRGPDNESEGTGIGLYVARQIVEDHQGTISIDSGRGQPTTVTIRLPVGDP